MWTDTPRLGQARLAPNGVDQVGHQLPAGTCRASGGVHGRAAHTTAAATRNSTVGSVGAGRGSRHLVEQDAGLGLMVGDW
jgi:hypothetical protein